MYNLLFSDHNFQWIKTPKINWSTFQILVNFLVPKWRIRAYVGLILFIGKSKSKMKHPKWMFRIDLVELIFSSSREVNPRLPKLYTQLPAIWFLELLSFVDYGINSRRFETTIIFETAIYPAMYNIISISMIPNFTN